MNLILRRTDYKASGIFSTLENEAGDVLFHTLEHAFKDSSGLLYRPKISTGAYECVLGTHKLDHGGPLQTYEVTGVPGHKGILFHVGNYNKDSDGCILVGTAGGDEMISSSKAAFNKFLLMQEGKNFTLKVIS